MNTFRILVADNHPIFRLGLRSLLNSHEGWGVCGEAADGRDAVEKCMKLKPDLLILDICMPGLNGVDAARQILKDNSAQRILVVTDMVCRGARDRLRKPGSLPTVGYLSCASIQIIVFVVLGALGGDLCGQTFLRHLIHPDPIRNRRSTAH